MTHAARSFVRPPRWLRRQPSGVPGEQTLPDLCDALVMDQFEYIQTNQHHIVAAAQTMKSYCGCSCEASFC